MNLDFINELYSKVYDFYKNLTLYDLSKEYVEPVTSILKKNIKPLFNEPKPVKLSFKEKKKQKELIKRKIQEEFGLKIQKRRNYNFKES